MTTNADSTLCARCQYIFQAQQEPDFLTEQTLPSVETTLAHHENGASFQEAVQNDCFICQGVDLEFEPQHDTSQSGPATRAQLFKTSEGEYNVAIFLIRGAEQKLGRVIYFNVTQISNTASLNVPSNQHEDLIRRWVSECKSGTGNHAVCQGSRGVHQKLCTAPRLLRVLQLKIDETSGEILSRLQNLEGGDGDLFDLPYATVSHHDSSSWQTSSPAVNPRYDLSTWHTEASLPAWLQQVVKAAAASSISYLWEPALCSSDDGDEKLAEIYAGALFNITHVSGRSTHRGGYQAAVPTISPSWAPQSRLAVYQRTMFRNAIVDCPQWATSSFHQALLLAPATLFVVGRVNEHQRLWWHCADGALYGDAVATSVPIGDNLNDGAASEVPQIRMVSTHTLDLQALLAQLFQHQTVTAQSHASQAERLAALWTSFVMPYSQTDADEKVLQNTANFVRKLASHDDDLRAAVATYFHGTWSGGLIYQLAWHGDSLLREGLSRNRRDGLPSWSWLSFHGPIIFEFLLASKTAGLMMPYLEPKRPHVQPAATAAFDAADGTKINARGRLLEADLEIYHETGGLQLRGSESQATVHFDCEEEEDKLLKSKGLGLGREQAASGYVVWPIFAQVDDAGRVEARGLVLRGIQSQTLPVFERCGWFQYSSADQESGVGHSEDMLELARGDLSMHEDFLIV